MSKPRNATAEKIALAKEAVKDAKKAHRLAFRVALAALFNEYQLQLSADGDLSAHLVISEASEFSSRAFDVKDLPE